MLIRKLYQAWKNFTSLGDKILNPSAILNQECRFCGKMTAKKVHSVIPNQSTYICNYCNHTYTVVDEDNMGRKKKNKQNRAAQAARDRQKAIDAQAKPVVSTTTTAAADDSWEVEIDCVEACSKAPDTITIWFQPLAKRKVDTLMKEYKNIEWLAYLLGPKGTRDVEDIYIPDQSISTARVDDIECDEFNNLSVIGVIHSHHTMGHSFSSTDHDYINGNHDISIVISNSGLAGQFRYKTPCGAYKIVEANVRLKVNIDFNDEEFIEAVKPKLTRKTYTTYGGNYPGYGGRYINGVWQADNWPLSSQQSSWQKPDPDPDPDPVKETNSFLTEAERLELEAEVEELDFTKELTLAEEMEMLDSVDKTEEPESLQGM